MSNWFQDISNATVEVLVWSSTHDPLLEMLETKQINKALLLALHFKHPKHVLFKFKNSSRDRQHSVLRSVNWICNKEQAQY